MAKPQKTITKKQWDKTHKDYKTIKNGIHYVLMWTEDGTSLVPVNIKESNTLMTFDQFINEKVTVKADDSSDDIDVFLEKDYIKLTQVSDGGRQKIIVDPSQAKSLIKELKKLK